MWPRTVLYGVVVAVVVFFPLFALFAHVYAITQIVRIKCVKTDAEIYKTRVRAYTVESTPSYNLHNVLSCWLNCTYNTIRIDLKVETGPAHRVNGDPKCMDDIYVERVENCK